MCLDYSGPVLAIDTCSHFQCFCVQVFKFCIVATNPSLHVVVDIFHIISVEISGKACASNQGRPAMVLCLENQ